MTNSFPAPNGCPSLQHVPDKGEHLVRFYGHYSNRSRGLRKRREANNRAEVTVDEAPVDPDLRWCARAAWARRIQKVYEVEPMLCPHCGEAKSNGLD